MLNPVDYSRYTLQQQTLMNMAEAQQQPDSTWGQVLPPLAVCRRARVSRDVRFDGRFFIGVLTTGIFCRPVCPARMPKEENVRYFPSAASAQEAGFRPCLRCRPEAARRLPEWTLSSNLVLRALRRIEAGFLNDHSAAQLAAELGIGERQLSRLFARELGASTRSLARLLRAKTARDLLMATSASLADVAYHAGYGSISRFNHEIRQIFACTPGALRGRPGARNRAPGLAVEVSLPVRAPYDFDWVFEYLKRRTLTGVEEVCGEPGTWLYRRRIDDTGWVEVAQGDGALQVRVPLTAEPLHSLLYRVRRVFDLDADGASLHDFFCNDPALAALVRRAPGLRVPGAWDGFETAVRAVLGQQVSVERGTLLANRMIEQYGGGVFPRPEQLVHRSVAELGMPGRRGRAVSALAQAVLSGGLAIDDAGDSDAVQAQLLDIEGIGPWTANYIRMRALKDPDAFPDNDWVVLKEMACTAAAARRRAEQWRPWRAYALMYLWYGAARRRAGAAVPEAT